MTFMGTFCIFAFLICIILISTFIIYCIISVNKTRKQQRHAAILQQATRRKLSLRTENITSPIKRPIISPHKLTKSATFTHIKDE